MDRSAEEGDHSMSNVDVEGDSMNTVDKDVLKEINEMTIHKISRIKDAIERGDEDAKYRAMGYYIAFRKAFTNDMSMEEYIQVRGRLRHSAIQVWEHYLRKIDPLFYNRSVV